MPDPVSVSDRPERVYIVIRSWTSSLRPSASGAPTAITNPRPVGYSIGRLPITAHRLAVVAWRRWQVRLAGERRWLTGVRLPRWPLLQEIRIAAKRLFLRPTGATCLPLRLLGLIVRLDNRLLPMIGHHHNLVSLSFTLNGSSLWSSGLSTK